MKRKAKVDKRGRLRLPQEVSEQHGLKPGDWVDVNDVQLRKAGCSRRAFLRFVFTAVPVTAGIIGAIANAEDLIGLYERILKYDPEVDLKLLTRLFGVGVDRSVSLIPAANHPFKRPPPQPGWYPIEGSCCVAYKERFIGRARLRTVSGYPHIRPDDSLIVFGSQFSNLLSRSVLGNPWSSDASQLLTVHHHDWTARLHWNFASPESATIMRRLQYGGLWESRKHVLVEQDGNIYHASLDDDLPSTDYLLITSLPRYAKGDQRIILFGGLHGPGTLAAGLVIAQPPAKELQRLERLIRYEPYYQALFSVQVKRTSDGELVPDEVNLEAATPLTVTSH